MGGEELPRLSQSGGQGSVGKMGRQPGAGMEKASEGREPAELTDRFNNGRSLETVPPGGRESSSPGEGKTGNRGKERRTDVTESW